MTTVSGVVGSMVGVAGVMAAGVGNAETASLTLDYECPFPLIGVQQVEVEITANIPGEITVGEQSPRFDIDTVSTAPPEATEGLNLVGASTIEGEALAESYVDAPEATLDLEVPANIPVQDVPDEGELIVEAFGEAPSLTFSEPGDAQIGVGDLLLEMTPRDENGELTGLGTFESDCVQLPDQDNILAEIEILPDEPPEVPVVGDHSFEVAQDEVLSVEAPGVLEGASPEDVDLTAQVESGPSAGSVDVAADGSFTYEPEEGFSGEDAFSYSASYEVDGQQVVSEPGSVTVEVVEAEPEPEPGLEVGFDLMGETYINAADSMAPLSGGVDARVDLESGDVEADLELDRTFTSFRVLWILPASAHIDFEQVGATTGTFQDGRLETTSEMFVSLPRVSVFGFPISSGDSCRTVESTQVQLASDGDFSPQQGGALSGDYTLPDFENCGPLTRLVNHYASGPGNTIDLELSARSSG
ncbi:Ig-like domain-containing protein [Haloechinothrix alba]|uniref:Ig-like domain-containing protein n=1 Tax=Haloechinothrix alba TaxID=664784 RepID=UPI001595FA0E|nr:Ig-like domain-containing protein [Haloechinothrix alba]